MQRSFTSQEFLEYLNEYVKVRSPDLVEEKSIEERDGNPTLFVPDSLDFNMPVDLVICGPCAGYGTLGVYDRKHYNDDFPMGQSLVRAGDLAKSWLHAVLERMETSPKNVVVYSTCCGAYEDDYTGMLQRLFPKIIWHFPHVGDLCDNQNPGKLTEGLIRSGVLKIVPAPVTMAL